MKASVKKEDITPSRHPMAAAVLEAYRLGEEDEAMDPRCLVDQKGNPIGRIRPGEPVIFYDLRGEREVELTRAFTEEGFDKFPVREGGTASFVTLIRYDDGLAVKVAFPPAEEIEGTLCETISRQGKRILKICESEKAIHLGFFFNGKRRDPFPLEERIAIPSPKGDYDKVPEMSAAEVGDALLEGLREAKADFILANFANIDVLGHIENEGAIKRAVETVDREVGRVVEESRRRGFFTLVTADHGTVEDWLYPEGTINTGHSKSPVPFILIPPDGFPSPAPSLREGGELADIAPTVLELMGLEKPSSMTGRSLLKGYSPSGEAGGRVLLLIMDGWGHREETYGNLIAQSSTPSLDRLMGIFPHTLLAASGEAVGMPEGTVGNSEAGHLHMGAGRRIYLDRVRIDRSIEDGSFFRNEAFLWAMNRAKERGKPLHLLGIVSFYSSHGSLRHLFALLEMARRQGMKEVYIHSLLGRRGERPESGAVYVATVEEECRRMGAGRVVTVVGRFWALDREENWDRVEKAYRAFAFGDGVAVKETA